MMQSLLPFNALPSERATEQATREILESTDTNVIRNAKNADKCPPALLPWLAWEQAVDFWDAGGSDEQKREAIKNAPYVHRHRGTSGAVRRALGVTGLPATVIEWWQETPKGAPYTFRIELYSQRPVPGDVYKSIRLQTESAKNLRSHLSRIDVIADIGSEGNFYLAGAVTTWIELDIAAGD